MLRTKAMAPSLLLFAALAAGVAPSEAAVGVTSITPSLPSPQVIGTPVVWTVTATDTNPGPLTFQFNMAPSGKTLVLVKDFNVGTTAREPTPRCLLVGAHRTRRQLSNPGSH